MTEASPLRLHEDPSLFREAVNFTAAETGFTSRLVEKDYFCSVLLDSELRPVLRGRDFGEFDLHRAFAMVAELAALEAGD